MDKTNESKKMNWRGSRWELYCDFADGLLNNIIFNYSVFNYSVGEFILKFWISHKIFK
jgi:hypothetical protein